MSPDARRDAKSVERPAEANALALPSRAQPGQAAGMARRVALLRAVNLGSVGKVAMADLRTICEGLGYTDVKTLLNSGNVVFDAKSKSPATLERELEAACAKKLGLATEIFLRTVEEWTELVEGNVFPQMAKKDPCHLVVFTLRGKPKRAAIDALNAAGPEEVALGKGCLYITYPEGIGRSKLNTNRAWKELGAIGTMRNWNTVLKIAAASAP